MVRPVLLTAAAAASIFASSSVPMASRADTPFGVAAITREYPTDSSSSSSSSSMRLSSSTMANPMGESKDGSAAGIGSILGRWFFLLYVAVSLLAGGKEMIGRIQKKMDEKGEDDRD